MRPSSLDLYQVLSSFELSLGRFAIYSLSTMMSRFFLGLSIQFSTYKFGHYMTNGGKRDRTDDLLIAKQVLSQLSYAPKFIRLTRCYSILAEM